MLESNIFYMWQEFDILSLMKKDLELRNENDWKCAQFGLFHKVRTIGKHCVHARSMGQV